MSEARKPNPEPTARLVAHAGPAYASRGRQFQGIPGIERSPGGRLWATWYGGTPGEGPGNYVLLAWSEDGGETWPEPPLIIAPPSPEHRVFDPCLWTDPRGRLWLFYAQSKGLYDGRAGVWMSCCPRPDDEPMDWGSRTRIADGVMMNKPIVAADKTLLLPIALWSGGWAAKDASLPCRSWVYASTERTRGMVEAPPKKPAEGTSCPITPPDPATFFDRRGGSEVPERTHVEHMFIERRDGSLWMLVRTAYGIGQSVSRDGGRTWSPGEPWLTNNISARFFIRRLRSGKLLLIRHEPEPGSRVRDRLTAFLSDDDGATWPHHLLLDERPGVSYPDAVEDPQGRIHAVYDFNRGDKHALGKELEILFATFTEQDVVEGKLVNGGSKLRRLINKATD
ncbi:MAG: sialidase family protein [Planctomycetota bacterium]|nr:sialidase family protein [Planctomycetota bacterium]